MPQRATEVPVASTTRCVGRVTDPAATLGAIEVGLDTLRCPRAAAPGSDRCQTCEPHRPCPLLAATFDQLAEQDRADIETKYADWLDRFEEM